MAEFIALVNDDWSLPLPATDAIDARKLRYTYEPWRRTIMLYQGGFKGKRVSVSPERSIRLPEQVISHMGLAPGQRFYYTYYLKKNNIPIQIKNDSACCCCGEYSTEYELISIFEDERAICRKCTVDSLREILSDEYKPSKLTDDEVHRLEQKFDEMLESERQEEERNGTLPRLKSLV